MLRKKCFLMSFQGHPRLIKAIWVYQAFCIPIGYHMARNCENRKMNCKDMAIYALNSFGPHSIRVNTLLPLMLQPIPVCIYCLSHSLLLGFTFIFRVCLYLKPLTIFISPISLWIVEICWKPNSRNEERNMNEITAMYVISPAGVVYVM